MLWSGLGSVSVHHQFRIIRPISGTGWMGWMGWMGWLSPFDGMLRAPTVLIIQLVIQLVDNRSMIQG